MLPTGGINISVVMATYNGQRHLHEQIASIVEQLNENDELVVSDDCSSDATLQILRAYLPDQVRTFQTTSRLGPIQNFDHALRQARGRIIVLADQDDVWLPGRLARVRSHFMTRDAPYDLLVLDSDIVDANLSPTQGSLFAFLSAGPGLCKNIIRNTYVGCHMAFRRELLDLATPFPATIPMHDVWLGLISESVGPVTFEQGASMLFRRSGENYTQAHHSLSRRVTWRVGLIAALLRLRASPAFRKRARQSIASSKR